MQREKQPAEAGAQGQHAASPVRPHTQLLGWRGRKRYHPTNSHPQRDVLSLPVRTHAFVTAQNWEGFYYDSDQKVRGLPSSYPGPGKNQLQAVVGGASGSRKQTNQI